MRKFVNHISLYSADNTHSHSDWNVLRTLIQLNFKQLYLIVYIASALHFQIKKTFFNNVDFKVFFCSSGIARFLRPLVFFFSFYENYSILSWSIWPKLTFHCFSKKLKSANGKFHQIYLFLFIEKWHLVKQIFCC